MLTEMTEWYNLKQELQWHNCNTELYLNNFTKYKKEVFRENTTLRIWKETTGELWQESDT